MPYHSALCTPILNALEIGHLKSAFLRNLGSANFAARDPIEKDVIAPE